jgi:DNA modification methylase
LRGKTHEAQKPKKLHEIPILAHTSEGETVLDPFAGSLMTGLAATSTGRGFVLVEKDLSSIERHLSTLPPDTQLIRAGSPT